MSAAPAERHRPDEPPPAPWRLDVTALVWVHRTPRAARAMLPAPLQAAPWLPLGLGGVVAYHDGPVGPYSEIFAAATALRGGLPTGHVPFMAVDSPASVAGGRRNWALPKVLAAFDGAPGGPGGLTVRGEDWEVALAAVARRRTAPVRFHGGCAQVWPDGRLRAFAAHLTGRGRLATVVVERRRGGSVSTWLPAGRHPGVLVSGRLDVLAPAG